MGTPREYGFNDISNENILKADSVSLSAFVLVRGGPLLAGKLISVREKRGEGEGAMTHVEEKKITLQFGSGLSTQPHWPKAVLVSVRTHASCLDESWMPSTVLECIGTAGGAGMPLSVFLCSSTALFSITDQGHTVFVSKQIRSWGCCNSHTFSLSLDLKSELKWRRKKKDLLWAELNHNQKNRKEKYLAKVNTHYPPSCCAVHSYHQLCAISRKRFRPSVSSQLTMPPCKGLDSIFRC